MYENDGLEISCSAILPAAITGDLATLGYIRMKGTARGTIDKPT